MGITPNIHLTVNDIAVNTGGRKYNVARSISSDGVEHGRNAENVPYRDRNYVRCSRCGFICNTDRDDLFSEGSKVGWGMTQPRTTIDGIVSTGCQTIPVVSTAGFPSSGTIYVHNTGIAGSNKSPRVNKVAYTGTTSTSFTGCTAATGLNLRAEYPTFDKSFRDTVAVEADASHTIYGSTVFSLEMWAIAFSNGGSTLGSFVNKGYEATTTCGYQIHAYAGTSTVVKMGWNVRCGDASDAQQSTLADSSSGIFPLRRWNHLVMVFNRIGDNKIEGYVNGVLQPFAAGSQAGTGVPADDSTKKLYIGNKYNGTIVHDGSIKNFRFYNNKALTQAEVTSHYAGALIAGGETLYFPFEEFDNVNFTTSDLCSGVVATMGRISSSVVVPMALQRTLFYDETIAHLDGATVVGEQVSSGCPQCGTYLFNK